MTAIASDARDWAPGSSPSASGSIPATIASVVMMIGRKRVWAASRMPSSRDFPRARTVSA
jgi:hypothetical protein